MPEETNVFISSFPDASSIDGADKVTGLQNNVNTNFKFSTMLAWLVNSLRNAFVPAGRTVNNKSLASDITLTAQDVGARPDSWTPSAADVGAIPTTAAGAPFGVAELDSNGQVPTNQLPAIPSQPSDIGAQPEITANGILKGDGAGGVSAATPGTDYATPAQLADKAAKADLTSLQATGTTNTTGAAIPAGAYFYLNGVLHRAKEQIDVNATFTPGTNCEACTVGEALFGQMRRDTLYNPGSVVSVATDTTLALTGDYRHYKFVQMVLYNAASATNTTRTILTIPTNDLESRVHYPLAFGSTVGSLSIGVGSTVGTSIRFYASAISPLTIRYIFGLA